MRELTERQRMFINRGMVGSSRFSCREIKVREGDTSVYKKISKVDRMRDGMKHKLAHVIDTIKHALKDREVVRG